MGTDRCSWDNTGPCCWTRRDPLDATGLFLCAEDLLAVLGRSLKLLNPLGFLAGLLGLALGSHTQRNVVFNTCGQPLGLSAASTGAKHREEGWACGSFGDDFSCVTRVSANTWAQKCLSKVCPPQISLGWRLHNLRSADRTHKFRGKEPRILQE